MSIVTINLHPSIIMHTLHTVFYTFPLVLIRRICLSINSLYIFYDHLFYSYNLNVWFRGDNVRSNFMLVTPRGSTKLALLLRSHHTAGEMRSQKHHKICGGKSGSFLRSFYTNSWFSSVTTILGFLKLQLEWSPWFFFTGEVRFALTGTEVFSEISNFTIIHTVFKRSVY